MIEIKSIFGNWQVVDADFARRYISCIKSTMTCPRDVADKHINEKRLRGITVEELFRDE